MAGVGQLRCGPHAPIREQVPLPLPPGPTMELFPAANGAPEAVMFNLMDSLHHLLSNYDGRGEEPSGEVLDYTFQCVARSWWRAISRWRE